MAETILTGERCSNCKFCRMHREMNIPLCKRSPPHSWAIFAQDPAGNPVLRHVQAIPRPTDPDEWCGEWKPRLALVQ